MKLKDNKVNGEVGEKCFEKFLKKNDIPFYFKNMWYDYELIMQEEKVEVKSCIPSVKLRSRQDPSGQFGTGRFDFTKKTNVDLQRKENVWVCFILRGFFNSDCLILGFIRARELPERMRYISLGSLRSLDLISKEEWLKRIDDS